MSPDERPTVEDAYDALAQTYETKEEDSYCAGPHTYRTIVPTTGDG